MADNPVTPAQQDQSASVPVPSDKQIEYTVDAMGTPVFATPGAKLPGHRYANAPGSASAAVAARYQAATAAAAAKNAAQFQRDTQPRQPQHATPPVQYTPLKKGKGK